MVNSIIIFHGVSCQCVTFPDFDIHSGAVSVQQVLSNWEGIMNNVSSRDSGFIVLEHDLFQQTVEVATGYILPDALSRSLTIEPVYACLKMPIANAYIETNDNKTNPPDTGFGAIVALCLSMSFANSRESGINTTSSSAVSGSSQSSSTGSGTIEKVYFNSAALIVSLAVVLAGLFATF